MNYYNKTCSQVLEELKSNQETGLTQKEAKKRLNENGLNKLDEKKNINPLILFLNQFQSFIIYILIFAVIISFISHEYVEATIILIILIFNAVFGFIQEYNAEKSIQALKQLQALKTTVIREGKKDLIDSINLVPGDIIFLEEGNQIPADCRLLDEKLLQTSEAALTGESTSVSKHIEPIKGEVVIADRKNMIFSGTNVAKGKAIAIVISTGMQTQIGHIANMLNNTIDNQTPLQKKLESFGKWVGGITLLICALIFVVGVYKDGLFIYLFSGQYSTFLTLANDWFLTAISLAVAAVPEGLPAIVTIALAIGVKKMLSKNALIRKLPSVETLGETTIICSDKTGTLTKNQMTVKRIFTINSEAEVEGIGYNPHGSISKKINEMIFRIGNVCNDSTLIKNKGLWEITGDPTEGALIVSSKKAKYDYKKERKIWKKIDELPFDSERKLMTTINENINTKIAQVYTKGAPENILEICTHILDKDKVRLITKQDKENILNKNKEYALDALRVLGFAYKPYHKNRKEKFESNLVFVGLQAMIDPPHEDVKESIEKCHSAGIRVIMITGDNKHTAKGIANRIGIEGESINGIDFANLTKRQKLETLKNTNIFARVEPIHKRQIVEILQEQGEIVAMTGDGVNDAPAIQKADMGIAMGINGTDVAKQSSEMILLDDKFTSIVNAIEEGRGIYRNIKKFVNYLFSSNLAEVMVIFFAILLGMPLPMTAIMLLWLNLITDGLPALALSVDPNNNDLMKKPPKSATEKIMDKAMMFNVVYVAILITIAILSLFSWANGHYDSNLEKMQTIAFTAIIVMELVRLQAIRSEYNLGLFSNMYLIYAVIASLGLQLLVIYSPLNQFFGTTFLNLVDWAMIFIATFIVYILNKIGHDLRNKFRWFE